MSGVSNSVNSSMWLIPYKSAEDVISKSLDQHYAKQAAEAKTAAPVQMLLTASDYVSKGDECVIGLGHSELEQIINKVHLKELVKLQAITTASDESNFYEAARAQANLAGGGEEMVKVIARQLADETAKRLATQLLDTMDNGFALLSSTPTSAELPQIYSDFPRAS